MDHMFSKVGSDVIIIFHYDLNYSKFHLNLNNSLSVDRTERQSYNVDVNQINNGSSMSNQNTVHSTLYRS